MIVVAKKSHERRQKILLKMILIEVATKCILITGKA